MASPAIPPPIEDIAPLVDHTHIKDESSDADDEQVIHNQASELPQVVQDEGERKRSCILQANAAVGQTALGHIGLNKSDLFRPDLNRPDLFSGV